MTVKRPTAREVYLSGGPPGIESEELERRFFDSVRLPNGVRKTTASHRLNDVDDAVVHLLEMDDRVRVQVLDLAASSGVTTVEWVTRLRRSGIQCTAVGTDQVIDADILAVGRLFEVLRDRNGFPLHFGLLNVGIRNSRYARWQNRPYLGIPYAVCSTANRILQIAARLVGEDWLVAKRIVDRRTVRLISPRAIELGQAVFIEGDLAAGSPSGLGRFDVVRAANILNRSYFSESVLRRMIRYTIDHLADGGLLVVVRSLPSGQNAASILRSSSGYLSVVERLGGGSEVEALCLEEASAASQQESRPASGEDPAWEPGAGGTSPR